MDNNTYYKVILKCEWLCSREVMNKYLLSDEPWEIFIYVKSESENWDKLLETIKRFIKTQEEEYLGQIGFPDSTGVIIRIKSIEGVGYINIIDENEVQRREEELSKIVKKENDEEMEP